MILEYESENKVLYEYEITDEQAQEALRHIMSDRYVLKENDAEKMVDFIYYELGESDKLEQLFEEQITDYFRTEGEEYVRECEEQERNELGYVGMKEKDFL
jgi:hypothetical protein